MKKFYSSGWGLNNHNTRLVAPEKNQITASNVNQLKLKWVYGLANNAPRSFPLVTEDTIFIADSSRGLVALDRETGCERWLYQQDGEIGSAIAYQQNAGQVSLVFTDRNTGIVAVDAITGKGLWQASPGDNPMPMYSGSPLVYNNTVYAPLSSMEIALPINPFYGCCTTSGGIAALDASTGKERWYTRSIAEQPKVTGSHFLFVEEHGPSGAPVWGAPTLDAKRGLLYFGTGQNYSHPATKTSDAIIALNINDGSVAWSRQFTANDAFNMSCTVSSSHVNCPDPIGPDVDFGGPPILATLSSGEQILLAGQKSGDVHAMNPDTGDVLWTRRVGRGGALGGVHWGMAINENMGLLFVPISDIYADILTGAGEPQPGMYALDIKTGAVVWSYLRQSQCQNEGCWGGFSAAITATDEVVFAGGLDGYMEAISAKTGKLLWSHNSKQKFTSVNDVETHGGAFDAHGAMVADDLVIVNSGYGSFSQQGGNALLVYQLAKGADQ